MKKLTTEEFIENAVTVHGYRYDYSLVKYDGRFKKVKIICKEHGEFEQTPDKHLTSNGCRKCFKDTHLANHQLTTEEFIQKSTLIHKNNYDYSLVNYINNHIKVKIICKEHGIFEQSPNKHLSGQGCQGCNFSGFNQTKPAYFYYIKINELYKVGITNLTVKQRITSMGVPKLYQPIILQEIYFENGADAFALESKYKQQFKEFHYKGDPIMKNGNSELFTKNILEIKEYPLQEFFY
ncbi:MAG: hypothetical protein PHG08_00080 [Bacilli bacterium]|nr:hypothetical protein [Bacilli bacterium]